MVATMEHIEAKAEVTPKLLRVLCIIPGEPDDEMSMPFARRQVASLVRYGIDARPFHLRSRTSPFILHRELLRFRGVMRIFDPRIVHAHFGTMTALFGAIGSNRPLVITYHGSDLNPAPGVNSLRNKTGRLMSHLAALRASRIICVSKQLSDRLWHRRDRIHVIPCGVDLELFDPVPREDARKRLGWPDDEKVVLFNARTDPVGKRLDLAEAAVGVAREKIQNLRLFIFRGDTHPDEMPIYYAAADCLLMTSDHEGSPMVVKEALCCNLPVVSVDVGDVRERLQGVRPSAIVDRDPEALGAAIIDVFDSNRRSNGRETIRSLGEQQIAHRIGAVYRSIFEPNPIASDGVFSPTSSCKIRSPPKTQFWGKRFES